MARHRPRWLVHMAVIVLMLVTLACSLLEAGTDSAPRRLAYRTPLPTLTPTPRPTQTPNPRNEDEIEASGRPAQPSPSTVVEPTPLPAIQPTAPTITESGAATGNDDEASPISESPPEGSPDGPIVAELSPAATAPAASSTMDPPTSTPEPAEPPSPAPPAPLPTDTPVPAQPPSPTPPPPTDTPTPSPEPSPTNTATPLPTATATPAVTPVFEVDGWQFSGIRLTNNADTAQVRLFGEVTNRTETARELSSISGTFYDNGGDIIAGPELGSDYWPIDAVPPGGRLPFLLEVSSDQNAADFDLQIEAGPSRENPNQAFEFLELQQADQGDNYCINGRLRNPGDELGSFLVIMMVLYDSQDQVINFGDQYERSPEVLFGDQTLDFQVCVDRLDQAVSRHELRAWGL